MAFKYRITYAFFHFVIHFGNIDHFDDTDYSLLLVSGLVDDAEGARAQLS